MLQIDTFLVLAVYLKIWQFILRWNILNSHTSKHCLLSISLHFIGFSCFNRDIWTIHSTSALPPFIDSCRPWAHEQPSTADMRGTVFLKSVSENWGYRTADKAGMGTRLECDRSSILDFIYPFASDNSFYQFFQILLKIPHWLKYQFPLEIFLNPLSWFTAIILTVDGRLPLNAAFQGSSLHCVLACVAMTITLTSVLLVWAVLCEWALDWNPASFLPIFLFLCLNFLVYKIR